MKLTSLKTNKEHSSTVDSEYVKNSIHNMNFFSTNVTLRKGLWWQLNYASFQKCY